MRRFASLACLASLTATGAISRAEPSIWDVARTPQLAVEYQTLTSVERFLLGHASAWDEMNVHKVTIDYLRGERYLDPRLELLVADLRLEATQRGEQAVRDRLLEALELSPDAPLAPQGFLELARIAALQGDLVSARRFFSRALERLWEPELRAAAYFGRAQAMMESGFPRRSLKDYRRALDVAQAPKYRALSHWGLGVALERSGNLNAGLRELRIALAIPVNSTAFVARTVLDLPDVSFAPPFERDYYKALAAMAEADGSDVPPQAILDYQSSLQYFERYLSEAEPAQHMYAPNARRLIELCRARILELRARETESDVVDE